MTYFVSYKKRPEQVAKLCKNKMNTSFNTIETIRTNPKIKNVTKAYIDACNQFEIEASKFADNTSFICKKYANEVSLAFAKVKSADCEYTAYVNAHACEIWLSKAWNNAD